VFIGSLPAFNTDTVERPRARVLCALAHLFVAVEESRRISLFLSFPDRQTFSGQEKLEALL